ncbi:MAG: glycosyltransferase, partial [Candidatus Dormibacteria bacterium]
MLDHLPDDIDPLVITFDEGPFADRLRARGYAVATVALAGAISRSTRERPQLLGLASIPSAAFALAGLLRRERIDVVHTNTVKAHFVGGVAARLARLPCISHLRDLLEGRSLVALRAVCALCSQERIAISGAVAKWYALRSTHVIDEPLDAGALAGTVDRAEARRALGLPLDGPIVAMVGRINRWKGQDRFIRAAALTRDRVRAHFAIVGSAIFRDADFVAELEAEVDRHGLRDAFTFVPWVTEVASAYAAIDLHANCSSREPFGRTTIEAAAFGVP